MRAVIRPALAMLPAVLALSLLAGACSSGDSGSKSGGSEAGAGTTVTVVLTSDGCEPSPASVKAGNVTFEVSNRDASAVDELELKKDGKVVAEKENLAPGLSGSFTHNLDPGTYELECPNAKADEATFTVTS
jgi:iron uptake system component EfeO